MNAKIILSQVLQIMQVLGTTYNAFIRQSSARIAKLLICPILSAISVPRRNRESWISDSVSSNFFNLSSSCAKNALDYKQLIVYSHLVNVLLA